jgi:hypothetical protein
MTGGCWCGTRRTRGPAPVVLGRRDGAVATVAALPDGWLASDGRKEPQLLRLRYGTFPDTLATSPDIVRKPPSRNFRW